jgi:hypothetical protein
MENTTYYIVQYNDRYGNGNDKFNECIVESEKDFKRWLKQYNKERVADGNEPEGEEEFDLLPINLFK